MKKLFFATAVLLSVAFSSMAGDNKGADQQTIAAFSKDFAGATDVKWQQEADLSRATFTFNGHVLFAYYAKGGELIATSRNIVSSQLPLMLFSAVKNEYSNFWISDLFEIAAQNSTNYYVTLENASEKKILKSNGTSWEVYSNTIKE